LNKWNIVIKGVLENIMIFQHPFRFSAVLERTASRKELITKAQHIEDLGYTTCLIPDHFYIDIDPAVALMAVADSTSLRIGSHVFCNDFRNPAVLAKQVATLDMLSEGRFQLGLGCGYDQNDYSQTGIPFDEAGVRVSRLEETLQFIKKYFTEDVVTFSGKYCQIKDLKALPKPVQKPHPPIYIGGNGKRMLSIAAREADIIGLGSRGGPDHTQQKLAWIQEAARERFDQLELSVTVFMVMITDHREQAAQETAGHLPRMAAGRPGMTPKDILNHLPVLIGTVDQIVETLQERRERYGVSSIEVIESHIESFAPVVARLAGK
jgi:probable F420-dependent oxidoreductase